MTNRSPEAKVTHLLLAVSVVFLLLHTPFHAIRIKFFILTLAGSLHEITKTDTNLHQLFRMIYNLDTCASCAVYLIFGDNFRRVFYDMYFSRYQNRCKTRRHVQNKQIMKANSALCTVPLTKHTCETEQAAAIQTINGHANDFDEDDSVDEESKSRRALLQSKRSQTTDDQQES